MAIDRRNGRRPGYDAAGDPDGSLAAAAPASWSGPVSHTTSLITVTQPVAADDPLRTGTYAKTLTFTLSTAAP